VLTLQVRSTKFGRTTLAAGSSDLLARVRRFLDAARQFGAQVVHETYAGSLSGRVPCCVG
jgi:hypothetical protein